MKTKARVPLTLALLPLLLLGCNQLLAMEDVRGETPEADAPSGSDPGGEGEGVGIRY